MGVPELDLVITFYGGNYSDLEQFRHPHEPPLGGNGRRQ
jgi:hypothetical protein